MTGSGCPGHGAAGDRAAQPVHAKLQKTVRDSLSHRLPVTVTLGLVGADHSLKLAVSLPGDDVVEIVRRPIDHVALHLFAALCQRVFDDVVQHAPFPVRL